jgi:HD domain
MSAMRPSGKDAKPQVRLAAQVPVERPGLSVALGALAAAASIPAFALIAPASDWGSGVLLAALAGIAVFSYFGAVLLNRSMIIDAASVAALTALVFLGPLPAACIWIGTEVVAFCFEKVRASAFFANVASYAWASIAGAAVLAAIAGEAPLSSVGPEAVLAVVLAGFAMLLVNYAVMRTLLSVVRDRRSIARTLQSEALAASSTVFGMAAIGGVTVLLYGWVGMLALALFALTVQVPQLALPAILRSRPVAELDHTGAVQVYALAIADVLDLGYRKCQVLKDAGQFIRERPLVPRAGELSNFSSEHRLALVEAVLYYREHWDGKGGKPGAFGGELIPLSSRILAVADAWAGLTSKDSPQLSHAQAMHQLEARAGMHFDPAIVAAAIQVVQDEHLGLPARIALQPKLHKLPLPRVAGRLGVAAARLTAGNEQHSGSLSAVAS